MIKWTFIMRSLIEGTVHFKQGMGEGPIIFIAYGLAHMIAYELEYN